MFVEMVNIFASFLLSAAIPEVMGTTLFKDQWKIMY